jgi:hypothetical protein
MFKFLSNALGVQANKYLEKRDGKNRDASSLTFMKDMLTAKNGVLVKDRAHLPMRDYGTVNVDTMPKLLTNMAGGGMVPTTHIGRPPRFINVRLMTQGVDQVPALLQIGELVIPKRHTPMVSAFLKTKNIKLPNM